MERQLIFDSTSCIHIGINHIQQLFSATNGRLKTFFSSFTAAETSYNNLSKRIRFLIFFAATFGLPQPNSNNHPAHYQCVEQIFPFAVGLAGNVSLRVVLCPLDKNMKEVLSLKPKHNVFRVVSAYPV